MDRKRMNTTPLFVENRSLHGSSQNDLHYSQFQSLEPKKGKFLSELPFLTADSRFSTFVKEEILDLWPDLPALGPVPQPEVQNEYFTQEAFVNNKPELNNNDAAEQTSSSLPSTSQERKPASFSDYNASDDVISIVDLADSPNSQTSYASEEDADTVIYEGTTTRLQPRLDESVVLIDHDDHDTENAVNNGDGIGEENESRLQDTKDFERSSNVVTKVSSHDELTGDDSQMTSKHSESQKTLLKSRAPCFKEQLSRFIAQKVESERAVITNLKAELQIHKQNCEWQEAKIRYLETKLQERNDFEYKLETVNQLNDMLERKLYELEKSAANLPIFEKELRRLREKTKRLEEDKRSKEELGQTISNLIDDKTSLKTENDSLTSIASMLEKENSTLKQKCETLEKAAAEKATNCTGDNLATENCCIKMGQLRDKMTETLENEFKCSICEEMFIEATVTNCNHVFCAHCLSEWMKKKRDCPHCRKHVTQQCRAPVIDEFVLNVCKFLSEKMHMERLQVVQERKTLSSKKVPQQTTSRKLTNGAVRLVPIASLRNGPAIPRALSRLQYMRSTLSGINNYYPGALEDTFNTYDGFDTGYYSSVYGNGASSPAIASSTPSMASSASSTVAAPPVQMHPLDARIGRHHGHSAQSTVTTSPSMHVSSTSSIAARPRSETASSSSTASAASSTTANSSYSLPWRSRYNNDNLYTDLSIPWAFPSVSAANPYTGQDETSTSHFTPSTSQRTSSSISPILANRLMHLIGQGSQDQ